MAFEYFISKRTLKSVVQGKKVSKPIVRISILSIAIAMIVNLITIAIVKGFQQEVRQKITGFGSHMFIMNGSDDSMYESAPILMDNEKIAELKKDPRIKSIDAVGFKPVLFQSNKGEIKYKLSNGKDTTETHSEVSGTVIKGVRSDFDWSFFKEHLVEGKLPNYEADSVSDEILISKKLASTLSFKVGDEVSGFFVRRLPVKRKFKVVGTYASGMDEFDKKMVIGDLRSVQELNDWGIKAIIELTDTVDEFGGLCLYANVNGGNGMYRYDWGRGFTAKSKTWICPQKDTTIRLIVSDYEINLNDPAELTSIADTCYLKIKILENSRPYCGFILNDIDEIDRNYLNDSGTKFEISSPTKKLEFELIEGSGSKHHYAGGFEVHVNNWDDLDPLYNELSKKFNLIANKNGELLKVTSIMDNENDIFAWLGFLEINVWIILTLMIIIGIINMGSALLVLILIRSNFIGLMKAMGSSNWYLRKIFLIQSGFLILKGMLWGNLIGISLCLIQKHFGIIPLNPEIYYLNQVPIEFNWFHVLLLNAGTLIICLGSLLIPSAVIARVNPVKSIKFN